ncbi:NUDIX domain-containing protein [Candidatus Nitrosocosmicus hydrocola]|uniref:NUDIX domain-containing protein n=1 Tax=Candidatus Nitrosocosmicus hydrocola TaxID=1826872 RepID=UPI0011E5D430|nr:NUDIX domain-containing protein [Candidatus Nitrosocosmicus hydrocola]
MEQISYPSGSQTITFISWKHNQDINIRIDNQNKMKTSMIVTSILGNNNKILILNRSLSTKSMQNKWAGISGYMEPGEDLLSRALIEINEETKIDKHELILSDILEQISVQIKTDINFLIQPFYFLSTTQNVILNWEHTKYRWINAIEIDMYEFVPRFEEILKICFNKG